MHFIVFICVYDAINQRLVYPKGHSQDRPSKFQALTCCATFVFPEDLVASQCSYEELMAYLGTTLGQGKSSLLSKEPWTFTVSETQKLNVSMAPSDSRRYSCWTRYMDQAVRWTFWYNMYDMYILFQSSADVVLSDLETYPCFS